VVKQGFRAAFAPRLWGFALYGVLGFPLTVATTVYLVLLLPLGLLLSPVIGWMGRPGLGSAMVRGLLAFGACYRWMLRIMLRVDIAPPKRRDQPERNERSKPLAADRVGARERMDLVAWRTVLFLILKLPLLLGEFWAVYPPVLTGSLMVMFPIIWGDTALPSWFVRRFLEERPIHHPLAPEAFGIDLSRWPASLLVSATGLLLLALALNLCRVVLVEAVVARHLLGPTDAQRLRVSRAVAVDTNAARLRQIERDLHDGTQAQLVALAMRLGMAREELDEGDPEAARCLVDAAHRDAKAALTELRGLTRDIHPPVLDAGLGPALQTLVTRCALPVDLSVSLPERPSPAIETIAYFVAAELLTNAAKHSGAQRVLVTVNQLPGDRIRLLVCDDGRGGAAPGDPTWPEATTGGTGLRGLAQRVGTVDGTWSITSPPGGPTVVTVGLPRSA
jgi:signal transduction histidine kinase